VILGDLAQDLRHGARSLRRTPGFTATVVLTLALGIGANAAIFGLVNAVLLRPIPIPDPEGFVIFAQGRGRSDAPMNGRVDLVSHELWRRLRAETGTLAAVAAQDSRPTSAVFEWQGLRDEPESNHALRLWVSGDYFDVLGLQASVGRSLRPEDDRPGADPVVVISHRYWMHRHGGDRGIIGARVSVNGRPHTVVGVMPPGFTGLDMRMLTDFWAPFASMQADFMSERAQLLENRDVRWLVPVGRLAAGVSRATAEAAANVTLARFLAEEPKLQHKERERQSTRFRLDPGAHGLSFFREGFRTPLLVLMVGVGLLLLIVYLNLSHLLLARALGRQREMSLRAAIGASGGRLLRQLMTEGLLLAGLGTLLGLGLARWLTEGLVRMATAASRFVIIDIRPDGRVFTFVALLMLASIVVLGLVPAHQALRAGLQPALRWSMGGAGGGRRLGSRALLGSQVAFSLVLLVGTGLLVATLRNLRLANSGFDEDHVLLMYISTEFSGLDRTGSLRLQDELLRRVNELPGVSSASLSFAAEPFDAGAEQALTLADGQMRQILVSAVTPAYFGTVGLRLSAGRGFTINDRAGAPPVAVINQAMARQLFGEGAAIGQHLQLGNTRTQIVGVLQTGRNGPIAAESLAYLPAAQSPNFVGSLEVRTEGDPALLADRIRRVVLEVQPNLPVRNARTIGVELDRTLWCERLLAALSLAFGLSALFLVCVGLYGVIAHWAQQRTREIGVRMALGATSTGVSWLVLRQALWLVLGGVVVGVPAALGGARLIQGSLFGVRTADPLVLGGSVSLMFAVAVVAAATPAWRASRVDPMKALRYE
jgi:predicted permease